MVPYLGRVELRPGHVDYDNIQVIAYELSVAIIIMAPYLGRVELRPRHARWYVRRRVRVRVRACYCQ